MTSGDTSQIMHQLTELREEHRTLDTTIAEMIDNGYSDDLKLRRLKMRKLQLKDAITRLESQLIPDLDA